MPITDSQHRKSVTYSLAEVREFARELRALSLIAIHAAGSGHPGGSLSAADILAALFFHVMIHDPRVPEWPDRDRFVLSKAHVAPLLYSALALTGYHEPEAVVTLRKLGSPFQGHTDRLKCAGVEVSGGSLGQGLGISLGMALAARLAGRKNRVFCLMGDGEQQEGSVWEAVMAASHHGVDNLVAIVDKNGLQIDGAVHDVMNIDPLETRYAAFGWHVEVIDGHDLAALFKAFEDTKRVRGRPSLIVARTVKGKGVSFMENVAGWHGKAPNRTELDLALLEVSSRRFDAERADALLERAVAFGEDADRRSRQSVPRFSRNFWWNEGSSMQAGMELTRAGFGRALAAVGEDPRVVTLKADISDSIKLTEFEREHPERQRRVLSVGIAEQNMMQVAAGLAREGFIPVAGSYGVFAAGRPWDQIRTSICYGDLNVKIAGAHGGLSVGPDGATHQALEELSLMTVLPRMQVVAPCDDLQTEKATRAAILEVTGPCYIRYAREATPRVTRADTPFVWGQANVVRFRQDTEVFADAFDTVPGHSYRGEKEQLAILACGPMVAEAMRAAYILKVERGLETRVIDVHTLKPLDVKTIAAATREVGFLLTVEEHQRGGFGNLVAGVAGSAKGYRAPYRLASLGVDDRFGESGQPWELLRSLGLTAEHIAREALRLIGLD